MSPLKYVCHTQFVYIDIHIMKPFQEKSIYHFILFYILSLSLSLDLGLPATERPSEGRNLLYQGVYTLLSLDRLSVRPDLSSHLPWSGYVVGL